MTKPGPSVQAGMQASVQTSIQKRIDRYEIVRLVHRGAMGTVYKATDTATGEVVALKVPDLSFGARPQFYDAFRREAALLKDLDHPGIVRFRGADGRDRHYLALEFLDGEDLRGVFRREAPLPLSRAAEIGLALCETLAYLHGGGIAYLDLKPENVIRTVDGRFVLVDFGLARTMGKRELVEDRAEAGLPWGTPDYASPEQVAGKEADSRSDIYSLGIVLFEAVTGRLPFAGRTPEARARRRLRLDPIPPRAVNSGLSPAWQELILRALEREPSARFQKIEDLAQSLRDPLSIPLTSRAARTEIPGLGETVRGWFRSLVGRSP
ncbi:MAG: serine/threonine protein kinase [Nitrospirae bacterium]|nr:serine/threonine protein kinase [Nitrospirota bacterium]